VKAGLPVKKSMLHVRVYLIVSILSLGISATNYAGIEFKDHVSGNKDATGYWEYKQAPATEFGRYNSLVTEINHARKYQRNAPISQEFEIASSVAADPKIKFDVEKGSDLVDFVAYTGQMAALEQKQCTTDNDVSTYFRDLRRECIEDKGIHDWFMGSKVIDKNYIGFCARKIFDTLDLIGDKQASVSNKTPAPSKFDALTPAYQEFAVRFKSVLKNVLGADWESIKDNYVDKVGGNIDHTNVGAAATKWDPFKEVDRLATKVSDKLNLVVSPDDKKKLCNIAPEKKEEKKTEATTSEDKKDEANDDAVKEEKEKEDKDKDGDSDKDKEKKDKKDGKVKPKVKVKPTSPRPEPTDRPKTTPNRPPQSQPPQDKVIYMQNPNQQPQSQPQIQQPKQTDPEIARLQAKLDAAEARQNKAKDDELDRLRKEDKGGRNNSPMFPPSSGGGGAPSAPPMGGGAPQGGQQQPSQDPMAGMPPYGMNPMGMNPMMNPGMMGQGQQGNSNGQLSNSDLKALYQDKVKDAATLATAKSELAAKESQIQQASQLAGMQAQLEAMKMGGMGGGMGGAMGAMNPYGMNGGYGAQGAQGYPMSGDLTISQLAGGGGGAVGRPAAGATSLNSRRGGGTASRRAPVNGLAFSGGTGIVPMGGPRNLNTRGNMAGGI
jgi:hypothetical protein